MATQQLPPFCVSDNETLLKRFRLKADGEPVDLTGSMFFMQIRETVDGELIAELSTENGGVAITDPLDGRFEFQIEGSELREGFLCFDILRTTPGGITKRLFEGSIEVERGTSQRPE